MKLTDLIASDAIVPKLSSSDRDDVIKELADALAKAGRLPSAIHDEIITRILERESKGSTGFGKGVAVPHVKHASIDKMSVAIGLSPQGVEFNALDKQPVYSVFLLLSPEHRPEEHLQAMEVIFKNLSMETFRRLLRQASTLEEVVSLLEEADNQQFVG